MFIFVSPAETREPVRSVLKNSVSVPSGFLSFNAFSETSSFETRERVYTSFPPQPERRFLILFSKANCTLVGRVGISPDMIILGKLWYP